MDESSSQLPTANLPKRAFPPLKIPSGGQSIAANLKKALFWPTALIMTPTFRPNRSLSLACLFVVVFLLSSVLFLFGNPYIHNSSKWFKSMLERRPQFPAYFPDFIFYNTSYKVAAGNGRSNGVGMEGNGKENFGLEKKGLDIGDMGEVPANNDVVMEGNGMGNLGLENNGLDIGDKGEGPAKNGVVTEGNGKGNLGLENKGLDIGDKGEVPANNGVVMEENGKGNLGLENKGLDIGDKDKIPANNDVVMEESRNGNLGLEDKGLGKGDAGKTPASNGIAVEGNGKGNLGLENKGLDEGKESKIPASRGAVIEGNGKGNFGLENMGLDKGEKNEISAGTGNNGVGNLGFESKGMDKREKDKAFGKLKNKGWLETMSNCDIFDGKWVKTDLSPLYKGGSCAFMDESFNCYRNGRPDKEYEKFRWQPHHCNIPRFSGKEMLRLLTRKRMVYVGDSLNRNMWESMVCLLWNSVKDKSRVFEASGRTDFKKDGAYSFIFLDYNCSVEYIRSAFLVEEWEVPLDNGSKKETLRLDMAESSYNTTKDADVLIFNTGNWWTHQKTSQGKGYYQEGDRVHEQLDVEEAFTKAMETWARWVETNIDPLKTHVFFRSWSFSHFGKGEWDTGGRCDDKDPIEDEKDLFGVDELTPPIALMLDKLVEMVKIPLYYQNVTRMTNYRRDAHPSLYRKPNMTEKEKHKFETQQDCSHWCLPGVPDTWNELLFAQLQFIDKQRKWERQSQLEPSYLSDHRVSEDRMT